MSAFCEIVSVSGIPEYAEQGEEIVISVGIRNTGDSFSQCYAGANYEWEFQMDPYWHDLEPDSEGVITCTTIMPDRDITFRIYAGHWDGSNWISDSEQGPYTVKAPAEPGKPAIPMPLVIGGGVILAIVGFVLLKGR